MIENEREKYFTYYFARDLYFNIKQYIKGEVKCNIDNDTLRIRVYGANGIVWGYTRDNIQSEIVQGLSIQTVSHDVVKRYRGYILNLFLE